MACEGFVLGAVALGQFCVRAREATMPGGRSGTSLQNCCHRYLLLGNLELGTPHDEHSYLALPACEGSHDVQAWRGK